MHHGTMLFSTNLQILANVLYVSEDRFKDRAVKSVRANTTNISYHLSQPMVIEEFADYVMSQMLASFDGAKLYDLSSKDIEAINELVRLKYSTWDWNYGYSPSYTLERKLEGDTGFISAEVIVEKGTISDIYFQGDTISADQKSTIKKALLGLRHRPDDVHATLKDLEFEKAFVDNLLEILF
jgi:lipoate-protein ligase A